MRIGINLLYLLPGVVGGTETYAAGLLSALSEIDSSNEYVVFVNQEASAWPLPDRKNFSRIVCPVKASSRSRRYLFEQLLFPRLLVKHKIDLVHSLGYVMPLMASCQSVVTIHDIVYNHPGAFSFFKKLLLKSLVISSAHRADHILAVSESSRAQIVSQLHIQAEKITVTYNACKRRCEGNENNWPRLSSGFGVEAPYILAFSSLSPSKNIPRLLQALAFLDKEIPENYKLVLVGHIPLQGTPLSGEVEKLGLGKRVIFTGFLPDEDLILLLKHASVFVFPSLYEGFGIPVLEAMEAGVPVVCSHAASLPEVAGNAALLFDPLSAEGMAAAMKKIIHDPDLRADLIRKGYQNVTRFSWKATAEKTLQIYNSLTRKMN